MRQVTVQVDHGLGASGRGEPLEEDLSAPLPERASQARVLEDPIDRLRQLVRGPRPGRAARSRPPPRSPVPRGDPTPRWGGPAPSPRAPIPPAPRRAKGTRTGPTRPTGPAHLPDGRGRAPGPRVRGRRATDRAPADDAPRRPAIRSRRLRPARREGSDGLQQVPLTLLEFLTTDGQDDLVVVLQSEGVPSGPPALGAGLPEPVGIAAAMHHRDPARGRCPCRRRPSS